MKIFHIADLHIGKQLNYYNLKENQEDILNQIVKNGGIPAGCIAHCGGYF